MTTKSFEQEGDLWKCESINRPITAVEVRVAVFCSYMSGKVHVRQQCRACNYTETTS